MLWPVVERRERERLAVPVDGKKVTAILVTPPGGFDAAHALVVLAHGAGNDMEHPLLQTLCDGLAAHGYATVRFNFPYREAGRKAPDPTQKLEATWLAVMDELVARLEGRKLPFVLGGKSMGGRIAAGLVAERLVQAAALVFLGYPLHAAGDEANLRDRPLRALEVPMLFLTGAKDRLCRLDLLERVRADLRAPSDVHVVPDGDHSMDVPRRTGRTREQIHAELLDVTASWLKKALRNGRGARRR